jgi:hypothetical protein
MVSWNVDSLLHNWSKLSRSSSFDEIDLINLPIIFMWTIRNIDKFQMRNILHRDLRYNNSQQVQEEWRQKIKFNARNSMKIQNKYKFELNFIMNQCDNHSISSNISALSLPLNQSQAFFRTSHRNIRINFGFQFPSSLGNNCISNSWCSIKFCRTINDSKFNTTDDYWLIDEKSRIWKLQWENDKEINDWMKFNRQLKKSFKKQNPL